MKQGDTAAMRRMMNSRNRKQGQGGTMGDTVMRARRPPSLLSRLKQ